MEAVLAELKAVLARRDRRYSKNVGDFKRLIQRYPLACKQCDRNGYYPLHAFLFSAYFIQLPAAQVFGVLELLVSLYPEARSLGAGRRKLTPLQLLAACWKGWEPNDAELFRLLASPEAIHTKDIWGNLPLHVYCYRSRTALELAVTRFLVDEYPGGVCKRGKGGRTPLHIACCRGLTERNTTSNTLSDIQYMIEKCPKAVEIVDDLGYLPLHVACGFGITRAHKALIRVLLKAHEEATQMFDNQGRSPLHHLCLCTEGDLWDSTQRVNEATLAASSQSPHIDVETFRLLASPEAVRAKDHSGDLPLHIYCLNYRGRLDVEAIRVMVDEFPSGICQMGQYGMTPLHLVVGRYLTDSDVPAIKYMINKCPEALKVLVADGCSPLHDACGAFTRDEVQWTRARRKVIRMMLQAYPEAAGMLDDGRRSPLHHLVYRATDMSASTIRRLLVKFPDSAKVLDGDNFAPLEICCRRTARYWHRAFDVLYESYPHALTVRDSAGHALLHRAVCSEHPFKPEVVRSLASKCTGLLESDSQGDYLTPLHYLCQQSFDDAPATKAEYLRILSISDLAVKAKNSWGQTPLHTLCRNKHVSREEISVLVEKYSKLATVADGNGQVPLHVIASQDESTSDTSTFDGALRYLLEAFPDAMNVKDNAGMTPLALACNNNTCVNTIFYIIREDPVGNLVNLGLGTGRCCYDESPTDPFLEYVRRFLMMSDDNAEALAC